MPAYTLPNGVDRKNILAYPRIDDLVKLIVIFEDNQDNIRAQNVDLFYALLAVKDKMLSGYKLTRGDN